jgi:hypothetical protein
VYGVEYTPDSYTYIQAWHTICNGEIDVVRTPSYPIFIGIVSCAFGPYFDFGLGFIQSLIFLLAIKYFWKIAIRLTSSKRISFLVTLLFILLPGVSSFCLCVLTESFSICGLIFLIYLLIKVYEAPKTKYFYCLTILTLYLIFLRPALLYILVAFAILSIFWFITKHRKQAVYVAVSVVMSIVSLCGYAKAIEQKTGVFVLTSISVYNEYYILLCEKEFANNVVIKDRQIATLINEYSNGRVLELDAPGIKTYVKRKKEIPFGQAYNELQSIKKQIGLKWYLRSYLRYCSSGKYFGVQNYAKSVPLLSTIEQFMPIRLSTFYSIIMIYIVVLIAVYCINRDINWLNWFMSLLCCGHIAVMTIGSYAEWARLFVPCVPIVMLMTAQLSSAIKLDSLNYKSIGGD